MQTDSRVRLIHDRHADLAFVARVANDNTEVPLSTCSRWATWTVMRCLCFVSVIDHVGDFALKDVNILHTIHSARCVYVNSTLRERNFRLVEMESLTKFVG